MPRNTTVNLVSEKGRKLTAEEHDETIGNLKQTADEAYNNAETLQSEMSEGFDFLFDNKLDKLEQAADSALLQGKGIGTNQGDVMPVGAFGIGAPLLYPLTPSRGKNGFHTGSAQAIVSAVAGNGSGAELWLEAGDTATPRIRYGYSKSDGTIVGLYDITFNTLQQTLSNKKISFQNSADASPTVLDWYEEGTFTPVVIGSTTAGTGAYSSQAGKYVRVGNRVHFSLRVRIATHTGAGGIEIGGLPFVTGSVGYPASVATNYLTFTGQLIAFCNPNGTKVRLLQIATGAASTDVPFDTAFEAFITGSYEV